MKKILVMALIISVVLSMVGTIAISMQSVSVQVEQPQIAVPSGLSEGYQERINELIEQAKSGQITWEQASAEMQSVLSVASRHEIPPWEWHSPPTVVIEQGSAVDTASFIIFHDDESPRNYYAKSGDNGEIYFSGTNAATVVNNAINTIANAGGGELFFKYGTYTFTSSILVDLKDADDGFKISAEKGTVLNFTSAVTDNAFRIYSSTSGNIQYFIMQDVYINCDDNMVNIINMSEDSASRIVFRNVEVRAPNYTKGFNLQSLSSDVAIYNCRAFFSGTAPATDSRGLYVQGDGINIIGGSYDGGTATNVPSIHLTGTSINLIGTVPNNAYIGILLYGVDGSLVAGNHFEGQDIAIWIQGRNITCAGNYFNLPAGKKAYNLDTTYEGIKILDKRAYIGGAWTDLAGTQNSGTATVLAGNTYVDITHGLAITPKLYNITITPLENIGTITYWVSNNTSTTFRLNISNTSTDNLDFGWQYSE